MFLAGDIIQVNCDKVELSLKIHERFVTFIPREPMMNFKVKKRGGGGSD